MRLLQHWLILWQRLLPHLAVVNRALMVVMSSPPFKLYRYYYGSNSVMNTRRWRCTVITMGVTVWCFPTQCQHPPQTPVPLPTYTYFLQEHRCRELGRKLLIRQADITLQVFSLLLMKLEKLIYNYIELEYYLPPLSQVRPWPVYYLPSLSLRWDHAQYCYQPSIHWWWSDG